MNSIQTIIDKAIMLRSVLHENPEIAFSEVKTRAILMDFLKKETSFPVTDRGEWFFVEIAGCTSDEPIAFRADFDAVSGADGKPGHYCGHDGHAATLAAFALWLAENKPKCTTYLIFQPAEEIGAGAQLCRELIREKNIKQIYGYHNIPGHEKGTILLRSGTFACASTGLEISFEGHPSHAAYPENGVNPSTLIAETILHLNSIVAGEHCGMVLGTVIGVDIGSCAYGVSAGRGILRLTLRGEYENEFDALVRSVSEFASHGAAQQGLVCTIREIERFAATENHNECTEKIALAAKRAGLETKQLAVPFRWSEDFGYYLAETKGAFFGVGDGEAYPQLHTDTYCFPDGIIESALKVFIELVR